MIALVCVLSAGAVFAIHQIDVSLARTYDKNLKGLDALTHASEALTELQSEFKLRFNLGGANNLSKLANEIPRARARIDKAWHDYYPRRVSTAAEKKQAEAVYAEYAKVNPALDGLIQMTEQNAWILATGFYGTELRPALARFSDSLDNLRRVQIEAAGAAFKRAQASSQFWQEVITVAALVLIGLALLTALLVARMIITPLNKARAFADSIAGGRLDNVIEHGSNDQFGAMIASLAAMQRQLADSTAITRRAESALNASNSELKTSNQRLAQTEALYRELFDRNPLPLYVVAQQTLQFLEVNETAQSHYGFSRAEFLKLTLRDIEPVAEVESADRRRAALDPAQTNAGLWRHVTRSGQKLDVELSVYAVQWGEHDAWVLVAHDVTAQRDALLTLELRTQAIDASHNGIFICSAQDADGAICYLNAAMARLSGQAHEALIGRPLLDMFPPENAHDAAALITALQDGCPAKAMMAIQPENKPGYWLEAQVTPVPDEQGITSYWIGVVQDITERKSFEAKLAYRADHDDLTGLPNREALHRRLSEEIAAAGETDLEVAVMFLDFDGFKQINDTGGHKAGDVYLQTLVQRLNARVRATDMLARVGGDEFVLVSAGRGLAETMPERARRLQDAFREPVTIADQAFKAGCSIGAACYPMHGTDADALLRRADLAMYAAKRSEESSVAWFETEMETRFQHRATIEAALQRALVDHAFELHYQPQVNMRSGTIVGVEALLRWPSADAAYRSPVEFIPVAEETGLIVPIGAWVLEQACSDLATLHAAGHTALTMAVNVSAIQLRDDTFAGSVGEALSRHDLPAAALEIEITESVFMTDDGPSVTTLRAIESMGVRLAIDDFGTGYSSLSYLSRLPIHRLKIDRSFISKMTRSDRARELVRTMARMAQNLKLEALAEGVEEAAEQDALLSFNCSLAQGFYYSRGVPMGELAELLEQPVARMATG